MTSRYIIAQYNFTNPQLISNYEAGYDNATLSVYTSPFLKCRDGNFFANNSDPLIARIPNQANKQQQEFIDFAKK